MLLALIFEGSSSLGPISEELSESSGLTGRSSMIISRFSEEALESETEFKGYELIFSSKRGFSILREDFFLKRSNGFVSSVSLSNGTSKSCKACIISGSMSMSVSFFSLFETSIDS